MDTPEALAISRLHWQLFCHLTFPARDEGISDGRQLRAAFAFLRTVHRASGVPFKSSSWILRLDVGDLFGKEHMHCLISGLPSWCNTMAGHFSLMDTWESIGGGMARVYAFDNAQSGVAYVCRCLGDSGGKSYEVNKFGRTGKLIFSHAAATAMRRAAKHVWVRSHRSDAGLV